MDFPYHQPVLLLGRRLTADRLPDCPRHHLDPGVPAGEAGAHLVGVAGLLTVRKGNVRLLREGGQADFTSS